MGRLALQLHELDNVGWLRKWDADREERNEFRSLDNLLRRERPPMPRKGILWPTADNGATLGWRWVF
jgi:hypothetical protein